MFKTPIDICNRALQHIGAPRISATVGFLENSAQASACAFAYDKLRRAELRRNVWRFATRRVVIRPIESPIIGGPGFAGIEIPPLPTMFLSPAMFNPTTTYFPGAIVSDASGTLWINNTPDNIGNDPINSATWDQYFGPLSVQPYDTDTTYFAGELVYNTIGDGIFRSYASLVNGNADNPNVPTLWGGSTYYFKDQIVIFYPAWAVGTTYAAGQSVSFTDGNYYSSLAAGNIGHTPSPTSAFWAQIPLPPSTSGAQFGTNTAITEWLSTTTYSLGNFVDYGGVQYLSIVNNNLGVIPLGHPSSWAPLSGGTLFLSLIDANLNNEPDLSAPNWATGVTYLMGQTVNGSDNITYTSLTNANVAHDPTSDGGVHWAQTKLTPWTSNFAGGTGSNQFMVLSTALTDTAIFYPVGAGPATQNVTKNVYRLPANFLRKAPRDPKAGILSPLGAPVNILADDWIFEGNFIVSAQTDPIMLRFVADVVDVSQFDDMFCEGLAARVAHEVCETLTQSTAKTGFLKKIYDDAMTQARTVNAIEAGAEEPPLDDYIACRL